MFTTARRQVFNNATVVDQVDFFQSDQFTRVAGVGVTSINCAVFWDNQLQPWSLASGLGLADSQIASGSVYFNEIPGSVGYYSVRWRPKAVGYWRIIITYPSGTQAVLHDFDVISGQAQDQDRGLKASFIRDPC